MDFLDAANRTSFKDFFLLSAVRPSTYQFLLNAVEFTQGRGDLQWCYLV